MTLLGDRICMGRRDEPAAARRLVTRRVARRPAAALRSPGLVTLDREPVRPPSRRTTIFSRIRKTRRRRCAYIGDSVGMAGFYGYTDTLGNITTTGVARLPIAVRMTNPPEREKLGCALNVPIYGFSGLTPNTVNAILPCILQVNFAGGVGANPNPILVTRGAGGYRIPDPDNGWRISPTAIAAQQGYATRITCSRVARAGCCSTAVITRTASAAGGAEVSPTANDMDVFEYQTHVYLHTCLQPGPRRGRIVLGPATTTASRSATLVRQELSGSAMVEVPLWKGRDDEHSNRHRPYAAGEPDPGCARRWGPRVLLLATLRPPTGTTSSPSR